MSTVRDFSQPKTLFHFASMFSSDIIILRFIDRVLCQLLPKHQQKYIVFLELNFGYLYLKSNLENS